MAVATVDLKHEIAQPPKAPVQGTKAWIRRVIVEANWRIRFDTKSLQEIKQSTQEMQQQPLPTIVRTVEDFEIPNLRNVLAKAKATPWMIIQRNKWSIVSG